MGIAGLYEEHHARLRAYAARLLNGSGIDPDDVLQDAWLRVHRAALNDNVPQDGAAAWLYTIVRHCCIDHLRARRPLIAGEVLDHLPAADASPPERVMQREHLHETLRDIAALEPRQRDVLAGHILADEPHERIADRLGTSEQAARSLMNRARRNLAARAEARRAPCREIQRELHRAHKHGLRPSAHALRHVDACTACQAYRERIRRAPRRRLGLLPLPLSPKLAAWLGGGAVAAGGLAVGAQLVIVDPTHAPVRLPAELPGRSIAPGTPLPPGYALVRRRLDLEARATGRTPLVCPAGFRATQLLGVEALERTLTRYTLPLRFRPMARRGATVAYKAAPGAQRAEIGVLCRTWSAYREERLKLRRASRRVRALTRRHEVALVAPATGRALADREASRAGLRPVRRRIPPGSVERTIIEVRWAGQRPLRPLRTEVWETDARWHSVTRNARTGRLVAESLGGPEGQIVRSGPTWFRSRGAGERPRAGFPDFYTRLMLAGARHHVGGLQTVAGVRGIVLRQPPGRMEETWSELIVEPRTLAPLKRSMIGPGYSQVERLVARERHPIRDARLPLDRAAKRAAMRRWRAEGATQPRARARRGR